jgi:hypothetical protein
MTVKVQAVTPRLAIAGILALASRLAFAEPGEASFPVSVEQNTVYVAVTAHGRPLGDFILDTGSADCVLDASAARISGARTIGEAVLSGAGRATMAADMIGPLELQVGSIAPLRLETAYAAPIDAMLAPFEGRPTAGLIGGRFFAEHVVEIDFAGQRVTLHDPARFAYRGAGLRIPLTFDHGAPIAVGTLVLPNGRRAPLRLLVDLGADASLLVGERFARAHPELERLGPSVTEPLSAGVGGETRFAFARLPGLELAGRETSGLAIGLSAGGSLSGAYYDALLGEPFLARHKVIFDYPHHQLILEPTGEPAPDPFDRSGAFFAQSGGHRFVVSDVAPGTPAFEAGLARGDVLLALGGDSADALTLPRLRAALSAKSAAPVAIRVRRHGRDILMSIRLRDLI